MVWIKDIWYYFLNESDVETGYLDYYLHTVSNEPTEYSVEIPKVFTRAGLIREHIRIYGDKKLLNISEKSDDIQLCSLYHNNMYDADSIYYQWIPFGKSRIFDYAEEWCIKNNFPCSKKQENPRSKLIYLECI